MKNINDFNYIFDMDGTLVNTAIATVPACEKSALKHNMPFKESAEISSLIGYPDMEFHRRLYPGSEEELLRSFAREVENLENEIIKEYGEKILFDGAAQLLNTLKDNECYMAIASTGSTSHVNTALKESGIYHLFEAIECDHADKASMVERIMQTKSNGKWLIVGDRMTDLLAGQKNEIITIAAKYGFGTEAEYAKFTYGIEYPLQLIDILTNIEY